MDKLIHTPEPWRIDRSNADGIEIVGDDGSLVHEVDFGAIPTERGPDFQEIIIRQEIGNSYLIAAAPELLEALKVARLILNPDISPNACALADSAIAKAEGK